MKKAIPIMYANYGRYIDEFRAMPGIDDCLKPVERRTLYALHDVAPTKFVKSARVVGETIAKYHAHGDGCLIGDTEFYDLENKIHTIESLVNKNGIWTLGYDESGQIVPVFAYDFRIGQITNEYYEIELSNGYIIKCTGNHQFLTEQGIWKKAEELNINDELACGDIYLWDHNRYLSIHSSKYNNYYNIPLHHIVLKNINENEIRHHIDGNRLNNSPNNLIALSRTKHAKTHVSNDQITSLNAGQETMFNGSDEYREAIRQKNKIIRKITNKHLNLNKALKAIKYLKEQNIPIVESNYELAKIKIYNLPKLTTIKQKYNLTFQELVQMVENGFKVDYSEATGLTDHLKKRKKSKSNNRLHLPNEKTPIEKLGSYIAKIFKKLLINKNINEITWNDYDQIGENISGYDKDYQKSNYVKSVFNVNTPKELLQQLHIFNIHLIVNIKKIIVDTPIKFYDFTVDDHHNAIIITSKTFTDRKSITYCVTHNSTYDTLVNLINRGFGIGQGNFGHDAVKPVAAAAYRYCVTGDTLVPTEHGLYYIKDLNPIDKNDSDNIAMHLNVNQYQVADYVDKQPVKICLDSGKDDIIQIYTEFGYELKGNKNHPILILNEDLEYVWTTLDNVSNGDIAVLFPIYDRFDSNKTSNPDDPAKYHLLGALYSQKTKFKHNKTIYTIINKDQQFIEKLYDEIKTIQSDGVLLYSYPNHLQIQLDSKVWQEYLDPYFKTPNLSQLILNETTNNQKYFLQTLFENTSYIQPHKNNNSINFNYTNSVILREIQQILLLSFGITSKLSSSTGLTIDNNKKINRLIIPTNEFASFITKIGFYSSKQFKFNSNNYKQCDLMNNTSLEIIRNYLLNFNIKMKNVKFRKDDFLKYLKSLSVYGAIPIEQIINSGYVFQKITQKNKLPNQENVYTLSVNSERHAYLTNGFASHNTECKINPKIDKLAFSLIKYVPYHDPEELEELQPDYIPSPIAIGLIGTGMISGISFNSTKIPRYKPKDLFDRLTNILYRQIDPNTPVHTIIPNFPNFDIFEETAGDCEKILSTGQGNLIFRPKMSIDQYGVHVYGRPPMGCAGWLKEDTDEKKIKYACDDLSGKHGFEALFTPKNGARLNQEFINSIIELVTIKIPFYCNIWDGTKVRLCSIDELLLKSYNNWSKCLNLKLQDKLQEIVNKLREMQIIEIIRFFLDSHLGSIKRVDDLCSIYTTFMNDPNQQLPNQFAQDVTVDEIKLVCKKHTIQKLFDYHIDKASSEKEMMDTNNILNNFNEYAYDVAKQYFTV